MVQRPVTGSTLTALARRLAAGESAQADVAAVLQDRDQWLTRQLDFDRRHPALLQLWGESQAVDDHAQQQIVSQGVIEAVSALAGVDCRYPIVHAGVMHTYGYLLSRIETPYGMKRDRWLRRSVERIAGLPAQHLSPAPPQGSLLTNLTCWAGQIAFQGREREMRILQRHRRTAGRDGTSTRPQRTWMRITETVQLRSRTVVLQTDLWPGASPRGDLVLIYSTQDTAQELSALITVFPIARESADALLAPETMGSRVSIRSRYNAWVPGLTGKLLPGERRSWQMG